MKDFMAHIYILLKRLLCFANLYGIFFVLYTEQPALHYILQGQRKTTPFCTNLSLGSRKMKKKGVVFT